MPLPIALPRTLTAALSLTLFLTTATTAAELTPEQHAVALVAQMTREEKIAQAMNAAPAIPRLGIPAYDWWSEGLHGIARNGYATVFPQAIGLAASWNTDLLRQVGTVTATEARAKFNLAGGPGKDHTRYAGLTLWSPNINIFRDPRWGRGMETYGEDPYLTSQLAVSFIRGLQGDAPDHPRTIATPKHFAVHSGPESGRHGFDVDVSAYDLEDTYTPAFRAAIVDGHAGSVMCAYNALHGTPVCAADWLLNGRLRGDWGFNGFVVSDCDAIEDMTRFHFFRPDNASASATTLQSGTDLNCGNAYRDLNQALARGDVDAAVLDRALIRLFTARERLGTLHPREHDPYAGIGTKDIDTPGHRALALQAAVQSLVLLKNTGNILPLTPGTTLAVLGPNADALTALEANYQGTSSAPVTPLLGLRSRFGTHHVHYAPGASLAPGVPSTIPDTALRSNGQPGLKGEYFDTLDLSGTPRLVRQDRLIAFNWDHVAPTKDMNPHRYAVRWTGELLPPGPGSYTLAVHVARCFDCSGHDTVRLSIDDRPVITNNVKDAQAAAGTHDTDSDRLEATLHFDDSQPHQIQLEMEHRGEDQGVRLEWLPPAEPQLAEAERAVAQADVTVAFVGLSPDVEGEELHVDIPGFSGGDRTTIDLPTTQERLLHHVKATGKPLIVVLMSGSAVALNWAQQHADAILAAWYPGQSGGTAIAQALAGDVNPGGRLPVTFYRSTQDLPPYVSYAMTGRTYRYFKGQSLYPFGYGLSYTQFAYEALRLSTASLKAGDTLAVSTRVRNTGTRSGDEVVQVYLESPQHPESPIRSLVGFQRVTLRPGESRLLSFALDARRLSSVAPTGQRRVAAGRYRLFVGGGQPGSGAPGEVATFSVTGHLLLPK
ncbi:glycoside hydrolase family 3 protein [Xylella taiwanensis]|uniref:Glycoside hydrolase family 3 n=1 Tax=Xylella taiwanensis TaxID=1444770 RepID=Z9JLU6_9GAMM|nr:glycoside hydrolase family 3 protein [Xylella taiwanensis]AXI84463.1 glycoside hydrolase family 3 [Xylella taiwanensis]EWS79385.1 glycoside hydrolase family 3 [Xylella taiwanensis]MCD8455359.1 glycoside hydrolase family 3 C-terminal domain-containing protein [Xylella taiwanensis]MCD8457763.1 glycoside hydrolase family 3 C-terminal domain-containing protein [Xylella taiwanensis]MCD8459898.1 glycoside hydrolase family 3 C-terminal domain-containing protein [Xylella taiwanensis]